MSRSIEQAKRAARRASQRRLLGAAAFAEADAAQERLARAVRFASAPPPAPLPGGSRVPQGAR